MNIRKIALAVLSVVVLQSVSYANYIASQPLRKLISQAENIVIAEVLNIEAVAASKGRWDNSKVILKVKEVLQGNINSEKIHVHFTPGINAPAPVYYQKSASVLVFVNKRSKETGYIVQGLAYGSKALNPAAMKLYRQRIKEMQHIRRIEDEKERTVRIHQWLVECARHAATRWEGVQELSNLAEQTEDASLTNKLYLTKVEKVSLRKVLFGIPQLTYHDLALVDLVKQEKDREMIDFLVAQLKNIKEENLWYADELMVRIAMLSNRKDLNSVLKKGCVNPEKDEKKRALIAAFVSRV